MTWNLPKTIAIIGGGPCGAGFAKAVLAEKAFDKVQIFEKRPDFGGLWNYTTEEAVLPVPSENPGVDVHPVLDEKTGEYIWAAPVYDTLDTNVPKDIMSYASTPFPSDLPLFPHRSDVCKYIKDYSEPLRDITKFGTKIVNVERNESDTKWVVTSRPVSKETKGGELESEAAGSKDTVEEFDAVVLANGNYELPYVPSIKGVKEWSEKFPGSIQNVKNYRTTDQFTDIKGKILVIGNSASANDLCFQITQDHDRVVYKSRRSENVMPAGTSPKVLEVPEIDKFDVDTKLIVFKDGTTLDDVEIIVFATGYLHSYPFLDKVNSSDTPIITNGHRLRGIYEHVLLYNYPNLAVTGAARYILPTRTAESQGSWTAKVWSGKLPYPSREKMVEWEQKRQEKTGDNKFFHDLYFPEDVHYLNGLNEAVLEAKSGLTPFIWDREQISLRGSIKAIKEAYIRYRTDTKKLAHSYKELVDNGYLKSFMLNDEEMKEHGF